MEPESRFADAGGIRTHYLEAGEGAPVVLIHGGGAGADAYSNWRGVIPVLARDFRVIAVDMVGFGQSDKPDAANYEYSQSARNDHLAAFLKAADLAPAALVGNSMGGATALGVAMAEPDLVSRLVLMGSAGLNTEISDALLPILQYDFTIEGMRRLIAALTGERYQAPEDLVEYRHRLSIEPEARAAYQRIMAWIGAQGGLFYGEDEIARVKTETLVINGREDLVVPLKNAHRFCQLLENSWGYFIPHCGHWAMAEAPEDFTSAVSHFLKR